MVHKKQTADPQLNLPVLIFGVLEVRRLRRELEGLEDYMQQAAIREPGKQPPLPRVSRLLEAVATDNSLQLLQADHRKQIRQFLDYIEHKAPNLHISFAIDPSSAFTAKIVTWLRANIHPYALLEVGLQPNIAAGCIVRTTNKIFDFSLRERFADAASLLVTALQAAGGMAPAAVSAIPVPAAVPAALPVPAAIPAQAVAVPAPAVASEAAVLPVVNVEDVAAQLGLPADPAGIAATAQEKQS